MSVVLLLACASEPAAESPAIPRWSSQTLGTTSSSGGLDASADGEDLLVAWAGADDLQIWLRRGGEVTRHRAAGAAVEVKTSLGFGRALVGTRIEGEGVSVHDLEGKTWSNVPLSLALGERQNAYDVDVAVAPSGERLAVWNQGRPSSDDKDGYGVAVATRSGEQAWTGPSDVADVLSPLVFFSNRPRLAVSRSGGVVVAWYQSVGASLAVFVSERRAGTFSRPGPEDVFSRSGPDPRFAAAVAVPSLADNGNGCVGWVQGTGDGRHGVFVRRRPAGGSWGRVEQLGSGAEPQHDIEVASLSGGHCLVVWTSRGEPAVWAASTGAEPMRLSAPGVRAYEPVMDGVGERLLVVWQQLEGEGSAVVARRGIEAGSGVQWSEPDVIATRARVERARRHHPVLTADGLAVVYADGQQVVLATE